MHFHPTPHRARPAIPIMGMLLVGMLPSALKCLYYRMRGARIGKGVHLGIGSYIASPDLRIDDGATVAPLSFIRCRARCHLGARSHVHSLVAIDTGSLALGEDASIGEQVAVGGIITPRSSLQLGARSKIFSYSFINPTETVTIGNDVCIGGGTYLFTHGTWQPMLDGFPGTFGAVTVEDGAWLGWRSFILPGVTIGREATIGAASLVNSDIPARCLAVGSPARVIKQGDDYIRPVDDAQKHRLLLQWLEDYVQYRQFCGSKSRMTREDENARLDVASHIVAYYRQGATVDCDTLLSLAPLEPSLRTQLNDAGHTWFDIANRSCSPMRSSEAAELRQFLQRYGLRFSVSA